jgi:hypothetical protein
MLKRIRLVLPVVIALAVPALALAQAPRAGDPMDRPQPAPQGARHAMYQEGLPAPAGTPVAMEPVPTFRADMGGMGGQMQPPPLPPNAWPTYAPYNNYSRVAYPNVYPACAFPHIGPIYPFPKAPLGWRIVQLQFDDGHWYLSSHAGNRDWWVIRYW